MSVADGNDSHLELAHVLFIDIVGYSKLLSDEQKKVFQLLNEIVRGTAQFQSADAAGKLVRVPTGDGMVLAFFTSVDAPVRCAREISGKLRDYPVLKLRMGINSGPVDEVRDVNDRPNIMSSAAIHGSKRLWKAPRSPQRSIEPSRSDDLTGCVEVGKPRSVPACRLKRAQFLPSNSACLFPTVSDLG